MEKAVCDVRVSTENKSETGVSLAAREERFPVYCRMTGLGIVEVTR